MKKVALMLIIALLALAAAGCTTNNSATPQPTDTTPGGIATQTPPTGTPGPSDWLSGYTETVKGQTQGLPGSTYPQVTCTFEGYYNNSGWTLPQSLQTKYGYAHHGLVYQLKFSNPTGSQQTVVAGYDIKSDIPYNDQGNLAYMPTTDIFYDQNTQSTYGTLTLPAGSTKEAYMLVYITNDSAYDSHASHINYISLDLNPQYVYYTQ